MRIDDTLGVAGLPIGGSTSAANRPSTFEHLLKTSLAEMNGLQANAENVIERLVMGEEIDPSVVANAVTKADLAFRTMIQIRNKLTQAFQELRQLQI
jgi:flagellar hook-basal body complex protein FliE